MALVLCPPFTAEPSFPFVTSYDTCCTGYGQARKNALPPNLKLCLPRKGSVDGLRVNRTGPTSDVAHFEEQFENRGVPTFNHDRAETLASMERLT
jgi:hypothetical protein